MPLMNALRVLPLYLSHIRKMVERFSSSKALEHTEIEWIAVHQKNGGKTMRQVIIYPGEDGYWVAECPSLPGCISQGETKQRAIANIKEAIEGYVLTLEEDGLPVPDEHFEALVETSVTYSIEVNGRFVIIEDVPARVNVETGERFFSSETVECLQQAVWERCQPVRTIETPVYDYAALT